VPISPNAVDQFPKESSCSKDTASTANTTTTTSSSSSSSGKSLSSVNAHALPCPPPCAIEAADADSALSSLTPSTTLHSNCLKVRFSPLVRVKDTLSRHDLSLKERHDYWLQDKEFLHIKRRNQKTIQKMIQQESEDGEDSADALPLSNDSDDCLRGLECALPSENLRRKGYRFAALEEVFLEQEDQYFAGIYDEEAIAQVLQEVTVECRFRAEFKGIQDRKDIEEYLQEGPQLAFPQALPSLAATTTVHDDDEDEFAIA